MAEIIKEIKEDLLVDGINVSELNINSNYRYDDKGYLVDDTVIRITGTQM